MQGSRWNSRFLASTRGRIIVLMRKRPLTVQDLADQLELTDNAVRAHLIALENEGLIQQDGRQPGVRKPHVLYSLTPEAKNLFPHPYALALHYLLDVLATHMGDQDVEAVLREAGHRMAKDSVMKDSTDDAEGAALSERLKKALKVLTEIGGLAELEEREGRLYIRGYSCPLASLVTMHPKVCCLAETLLTDIAGVPVKQCCDRTGTPRCYFEVGP